MAGLSCEGLTDTSAKWIERAECRGKGVDLFFVERGYTPYEALEMCRVCPVKRECLDYAVKNGLSYGVWGGVAPRGRRRYAKPHHDRYLSSTARTRILWLDARGWTNREIAAEFGVNERTVARILAKDRA